MSNDKIREKINSDTYGRGALLGFENCVTPVAFYKGEDGFYIYKNNTQYMSQDIICHSKSIEGLIQFMQGALWFRLNYSLK